MKQQTIKARLFGKAGEGGRLRAGLIAAFILFAVVLNVVIYGLATKFTWYFYAEESYSHTIGGATDPYLEEVADEGEVTIIFCDSADALEGDVVYNLVWQTANQFAARYDFVGVETVNIFTHPELVERYKYQWDEETDDYARDENGERIRLNTINTSSVIFAGSKDYIVLDMSSFFVLDKENTITAYNGEEITAAMIRWSLTEEHPTAYFTASHGETYSSVFYNRLVCAGYRVEAIDLLTQEIEKDGIVIISNPLYDFVEGNAERGIRAELEKLDEFLSAGGSVYVMLDPLVTNTVRLEKFLAKWGLVRAEMTVKDTSEAVTNDGYALITSYAEGALGAEVATRMEALSAGRVILRQASPIVLTEVAGKTVSPVLVSSAGAVGYHDGAVVDDAGSYVLAAVSKSHNGGGVFLVSSAYLTSFDAITTNEYGNRDLIFLMLEHLSGASVPAGCSYVMFSPTTLEDLTMREARWWCALVAVIAPLAVALTGVVTLTRRRNR